MERKAEKTEARATTCWLTRQPCLTIHDKISDSWKLWTRPCLRQGRLGRVPAATATSDWRPPTHTVRNFRYLGVQAENFGVLEWGCLAFPLAPHSHHHVSSLAQTVDPEGAGYCIFLGAHPLGEHSNETGEKLHRSRPCSHWHRDRGSVSNEHTHLNCGEIKQISQWKIEFQT